MRKFLIAAAMVAVALPAFAQSQMNPPANPAAPVAGANSFTEGQAKSRIEANGYTNVSGLKKDDAGVWRGKASKGNQSMNVSVDFQGNVVSR
jgi:opacity protein-like surface antigen